MVSVQGVPLFNAQLTNDRDDSHRVPRDSGGDSGSACALSDCNSRRCPPQIIIRDVAKRHTFVPELLKPKTSQENKKRLFGWTELTSHHSNVFSDSSDSDAEMDNSPSTADRFEALQMPSFTQLRQAFMRDVISTFSWIPHARVALTQYPAFINPSGQILFGSRLLPSLWRSLADDPLATLQSPWNHVINTTQHRIQVSVVEDNSGLSVIVQNEMSQGLLELIEREKQRRRTVQMPLHIWMEYLKPFTYSVDLGNEVFEAKSGGGVGRVQENLEITSDKTSADATDSSVIPLADGRSMDTYSQQEHHVTPRQVDSSLFCQRTFSTAEQSALPQRVTPDINFDANSFTDRYTEPYSIADGTSEHKEALERTSSKSVDQKDFEDNSRNPSPAMDPSTPLSCSPSTNFVASTPCMKPVRRRISRSVDRFAENVLAQVPRPVATSVPSSSRSASFTNGAGSTPGSILAYKQLRALEGVEDALKIAEIYYSSLTGRLQRTRTLALASKTQIIRLWRFQIDYFTEKTGPHGTPEGSIDLYGHSWTVRPSGKTGFTLYKPSTPFTRVATTWTWRADPEVVGQPSSESWIRRINLVLDAIGRLRELVQQTPQSGKPL